MKTVYFISGLGADERAFQHLDLSFCNPVFIKWTPVEKSQSIESYARGLLSQIDERDPVLVGLSFGGMLAVEIAKLIPCEKIILISSAKYSDEIPDYFRWIGKVNAQKLLPLSVLPHLNFVNKYLFGTENKSEEGILTQIIKDTDPQFLKWAISEIVHWENKYVPKNIVHIHGDRDRILPIKYVKADYVVKGGGHFMIIQKAMEISMILSKEIG